MNQKNSKSGGGLVLVMIVMLSLSALAIGLFKLQEMDSFEALYVDQSSEAFWMAESGLNEVGRLLRWDEIYRQNPEIVSTNFDGASYSARVVDQTSGPVLNSVIYSIESTGNKGRATRRILQDAWVIPGAEASIILKGGKSVFQSNNNIYDPVMMFDGEIVTGNNRTSVFHDYIVGSSSDISGRGQVAGSANPPFPFSEPTLDASVYNVQIPAVGSGSTNIGNTTIYYDAEVTIETAVPAGTTIIAAGNLDFGNTHAIIGSDVEILAGGSITFPGHSTISANTLVYAVDNIEFSTHGAGDSVLSGVSLLSSTGDISFSSQLDFDGLIFSDEGTVYIGAGADITGAIIGGLGLDKSATGTAGIGSVNIRYSESVFMSGLPVGIDMGGLAIVSMRPNWREL